MAGTNSSRRERLGATLLAALLALSVVAGVAGLGAASDGTDHVTRNGDKLVVKLGENATATKQISVSVAGKTYTHPEKAKKKATDTFRIPVKKLSVRKKNLKNATVTVKSNGTELFSETANLRYLKFGKTKAATFENGKLRVPLKQALGYEGGTSVALKLDGSKKPVSGTVKYENGNPYLAVKFDAGAVSLPLDKKAKLAVPNRAKTSMNIRKHVADATRVTALDGRTLAVSNPLFGNGQYDLTVETSGGRFAGAVGAKNGRLTLADSAVAAANRWTVSAYRDGQPLFVNVTEQARSTETIAAKVSQNGSVVSLADQSVTAKRTTVWLTNATRNDSATDRSRYVSVSVPVKKGDVNLSSTPYRLNPDGGYRVIVTGEQFVRAAVTGNESANDTLFYASQSAANGGGGTGDGDSSGVLSLVTGNKMLLGGAVVVLLVGVVGVVAGLRIGGGGSSSGTSAGASSGTRDHQVELRAIDAGTNSLATEDVRVVAEQKHRTARRGSDGHEEVTLTGGSGSVTLQRGTWRFAAEAAGVTDEKRPRKIQSDETLQFELGPRTVPATVTDGEGQPLSNVPVTATIEGGQSDTRRTDSDGSVTFSLPLGAEEVELSASHEKYDDDATTVALDGSVGEQSLSLELRTGGLDVTVTVDGAAVSGLPVEIRSREKAVREVGGNREATTGADGAAEFDDLPVGKYEAGTEIPGDAFAVQSKRVRVRDGQRTRATLDASFEYGLDRRQRDRIADIRRDVDALTTASGRDVAIPRYYGSVVTALLDAVERLPREGHRFAIADADPDEVVAALLDTAEETVELVDDAMATKRNTDLFGACVDMPDARVEWSGDFEAETLFGLLAEDRTAQRQPVRTQLQAVDDRINDERSDVAVVAPARELWEGVQRLVQRAPDDDPVRGAAVVLAASGLLDAVDELFDHEELRERLERTVF
ncbi:hypothetical protein M0R88_09365 [Halorussus gelatinilyticus]|uniref:Carboxypeptidase regulatory-like domain-containing protein n=1 Tax=Halorussus gelatinilyticus TaxID=2937524 RepID=A0A8U0INW0_9EURY|nr:hypothetical protein [Halorussus gelatinilyticus]UPW02281.1 hypothetical protein M0R88_09365 [Halorussus gelatinilyticus]